MPDRVELDRVWKGQNASEGRWINRARLLGCEATGDGPVICNVIRAAIDAGHVLSTVEVWRGDCLVFPETPAAVWARLRVTEKSGGSARFAKWTDPASVFRRGPHSAPQEGESASG